MLPLAILAGCGDGSDITGGADESDVNMVEPVDVIELTEPTLSPEPEVVEPESVLQYQTGALSAEEEAVVLEAMTTLQQNLEIPEYMGEGIHMISNEEWLDGMCKGIYEGSRSYFLQKGTEVLLILQLGYDIAGEPYANVFCPGENGAVLVLKQAGRITWLLQTNVVDGEYQGEFEIWQFDGESGHIQREQGTYAAGIIVGEYKKSEYTGGAGEAFDMWTNRENFEYKTTTITYDETGEPIPTATPQPTATPKPATQRPPAQSTPQPTPQPTPEPTPQPPQNPQPPVQQPQPTPAPTQEPPADSGPTLNTDDDVDYREVGEV